MANHYDYGDALTLSLVTTVGGVADDPTTLSCKYRLSGGAVTTLTLAAGQITRDSEGHFHVTITPAFAGLWLYQWIGTGAAAGAEAGEFYIDADPMA